ncbi:hypothetical protein HO133_000669 [Letharia lupina]|uniref:Uncharacterized protein n=1 Tax=Letharia lupina TaxID=560253 RepID=A0A8H6FBS6_9LECA|nr:uncharacterized protein HO133_000669 [Letharia lupina]KAF6222622.1 hypothetical protein HO133_000669 [Letharia lupina]
MEECKRCVKNSISPLAPIAEHPPAIPCNWNLAFQKHAANIHLRLPGTNNYDFLKDCEKPLQQIVQHFTNLRTLRLDFLDVSTGQQSAWDVDEYLMHDLLSTLRSTIWSTMKEFQAPDRSAGALKEIVLTGLPQNDLRYVMKQYARLLARNGRFCVGWGVKRKRYELLGARGDGEVTKREDLELLWMRVEEEGEWIAGECHKKGSRWLFTRQKPESKASWSQSPPLPEPEQSQESKAWDQEFGEDLETLASLDNLRGRE